ncbi:nucleolar and coiled-body phosphoprotein 1-like [Schistocerca gregaria]|uniref:nucleolar and coiled-body phosphoprotein 1-like n=1 Tax=Schistocerca gregaria TaxID=7010 RepID=UPI00211E9453|nr:nucleolar and coiled-body phosphoprotein 1-like [Schistocerca gregaria]
MPNRADRCEDVKGVADRRPAELALSATPSGPPTATTRQMDMDHESDSSTDRRSRYATSATAEAASGSADGLSAGPAPSAAANRRPPTTVRPSRNGDTQRSRRALSADGGLPLHAYARVLDVGGPSASSCATKENSSAATVLAVQQPRAETDASATVPEQTKSLAPVASMDAAHTPEAERQLAFLMGLIPGTKPAAETMEVEKHSRKRPADASAATTCKRSATSSNSSAPTLRTQRKASRKGNKTLPPTADDEGFTQPSRKHTARAVVLAQQSAINTGNRYSGLSNDAGEPMESQQQRKSPPPPPVVIKWTGGFKEFREKIKAAPAKSTEQRPADAAVERGRGNQSEPAPEAVVAHGRGPPREQPATARGGRRRGRRRERPARETPAPQPAVRDQAAAPPPGTDRTSAASVAEELRVLSFKMSKRYDLENTKNLEEVHRLLLDDEVSIDDDDDDDDLAETDSETEDILETRSVGSDTDHEFDEEENNEAQETDEHYYFGQ